MAALAAAPAAAAAARCCRLVARYGNCSRLPIPADRCQQLQVASADSRCAVEDSPVALTPVAHELPSRNLMILQRFLLYRLPWLKTVPGLFSAGMSRVSDPS